jgi:pyruvate dehydrogenase E2 component (dihydrolipoamide acetyltransferase)
MATEFTMPKLGLTMEEATIIEWLVGDGEPVAEGVAVMRIETDKVETEVEISTGGVLHHVAREGDVFACGAVIAYVLSPGEAPPSTAVSFPPPAPAAIALAPTTVAVGVTPSPIAAVIAGGRLLSSPNARRVALDRGVDLAGVIGTGPGGRIVSADVLEHRPAKVAETALLQTPSSTVRLTGMRGTIAKRMLASLRDMAQLTLTMDADMTAVVADRAARKIQGTAPSFTDYVIAAAARALRQHKIVNSQVVGDEIALLADIHVGLAVALDNGLIVPVIRHADQLRLGALSAETSRLATGARNATLAPSEYEGATFSVSTLGMFGVDSFTPVINPPNAAILGVGRVRDDVVALNGTFAIRPRLTLSLSWDHRVLDGAPAAAFCRSIVEGLEHPYTLA